MKSNTKSTIRKAGWIGLALLCASGFVARAGQPDSKETKTIIPPENAQLWHFDIALPGWLAATSGTIGLDGVNSHVYLGVDKLIKSLDMIGAISAEARYGRFGMYSDYMYVSAAGRAYQDGILQKVDVHLNETIANLEASYRIVEGPKGFVDLRAGVRFTSIYSNIGLHGDNNAIDQASANFVDATTAQIASILKNDLRGVIDGREPVLPVAPLTADQQEKLQKLITIAKNDPRLVDAIKTRDAAQIAAAQAAVAATTAELRAKADAAETALRTAQAQVDQAKSNVQQKIASALKKSLNSSASLQEYWFDPYVGFRAQYNFTNAFYFTAKADIGGFGLGSIITWQGSAELGCQITRNIYLEVGYHYLYTDYGNNGFVYNVNMQGPEINLGVRF